MNEAVCTCFGEGPEWFDTTCPEHGPMVVACLRRAGDTTEPGDVKDGWTLVSGHVHKSEIEA